MKKIQSFIFLTVVMCSALFAANYAPPELHVLAGKSMDGKTFQFEDGSQWKVDPSYRSVLRSWRTNDHLFVLVNSYWFANTKYVVRNARTQSEIEVNLNLGPFKDSPYTKTIVSIDRHRGEILLEDGSMNRSVWRIDQTDLSTIRNWKQGNAVIIGKNEENWYNGWFSTPSECILINVNKDRPVRGDEI